MVRLSVTLCVVLSVVVSGGGASAYAQPRPQVQLPDADGDGHPMFGNPQIRTGFEEIVGGQLRIGDATSVVFADLDGDGDLDAVVTNTGGVTVFYITVLINRGDGVFDPPVRYDTGAEPTHVIAADLDGDGVPDLAVANAASNDVSVFINNGDGTFGADVKYLVGTMPRSLVSADFDGDGDIDIATLNTITHDVSVLLNNGDGSFAPAQRIAVGGVTQRGDLNLNFPVPGPFMTIGDLDGDGIADLAVPAHGRIKLLLGDGNGLFLLANQHASVPNGAYAVVMGDLDNDGDNDLATVATSELGGEALSVVLNTGGGVFGPATTYSVATQPSPGALYRMYSLALGDLEDDGDLDIVVGYDWRQLVSVFRNNGDGSYAPKETHPVHPSPWFVAWADVNGDGALDLAVLATGIRSKLAILLNDGDGALITQEETPPYFPSIGTSFPWFNPTSVAAADLDGDGDQDLAVSISAPQDPSTVTIMFNDGTGTFDPIVPHTLGPVGASSAEHVAIADLNGDGIPDLAVADAIVRGGWDREGKIWILIGMGGGAFSSAVSYQLNGLYPAHVATGDLDGDGDTDLALWTTEPSPRNNTTPVDRRVVIMLNDGTGIFEFTNEYTIGAAEWLVPLGSVAVGDLDGDGDLDLAATMSPRVLPPVLTPGTLAVFLNDGNAAFLTHLVRRVGPQPYSVAMFDAEGDGDLDLGLSHNHTGKTEFLLAEPIETILFNDGNAGFPIESLYVDPFSHNYGKTAIADVDGDGDLDLVHQDIGNVDIQLNNGQGQFEPGVRYGTGDFAVSAAVADFDGDGRMDIVTANSSSNNITLIRNLGAPPSPPCYADCDTSSGVGVLDMADFLCFQAAFTNADPYACDCDTSTGPATCDIFDFLCFQNAFVSGCP